MEQKGKLVTCDLCGESVFLKYIGSGSANGGYTRWDEYMPFPKGWASKWFNGEIKTVCPVCAKKYDEALARFMEEFKR